MSKKHLLMILLVGAVVLTTTACGEEGSKMPEWEWNDPTPSPTPTPDDSDNQTVKPRFIWIDAAANFHDYANSKEKIESDMLKVASVGFTDIVVDVRPTTGDVLFRTTHTEQVTKLHSWNGGTYHWEERTATWDYLDAFIEAGHKAGLRVHAGFNTMVCGLSNGLGNQGLVYRDRNVREWITVINSADGLQSAMDNADYSAKFLNPAHPDAVNYLCNLLKDLAAYEELDGIILDRCRYDNILCDFSDVTRQQFEKHLGKTITNWPSDVMTPGSKTLPSTLSTTQLEWLEFRVKTIHDFIVKAREAVKGVNPDISFGAYVGAWYSTYYEVGVNWASPSYRVGGTYKWATPDYKDYGYADHVDLLLMGAYASAKNIYGDKEWSVQGFCKQAEMVVMNACKVFGGPDIGNWVTDGCNDLPTAVMNTVDAAINACDGYYCFDLIHVKKYDYWDALQKGISKYLRTVNQE